MLNMKEYKQITDYLRGMSRKTFSFASVLTERFLQILFLMIPVPQLGIPFGYQTLSCCCILNNTACPQEPLKWEQRTDSSSHKEDCHSSIAKTQNYLQRKLFTNRSTVCYPFILNWYMLAYVIQFKTILFDQCFGVLHCLSKKLKPKISRVGVPSVVPETHTGAGSSPACSTSDPASC